MKTVLITGASRGIGAATARAFAKEGYAVAVHYVTSEDKANALVAELIASGCDAFAVKADIGVSAEVNRMVDEVQKRFGHIDVLVNNAGICHSGLLTDLSDAEWDRILAVDLSGTFYACRAVLPQMIARKSGVIVNVSSMWGQSGASCEAAYSAAKAGLIGLTQALAKEVGPSGVRVNAVAPGAIDTDMNANLTSDDRRALCDETPCGRFGTPAEIASVIAFLASDAASFITGEVIAANGGLLTP